VRSPSLRWSFVALVCLGAVPCFTPCFGAPTVLVGAESIQVTGATASGQVVVFGMTRRGAGMMTAVERIDEVVAADALGEALVELGRPVPERSVWAAVDLTSGEIALAAPAAFELREVSFPQRGIGATRRHLEDARRFLDVLLVRPVAAVPAGQDAAAVAGAWGRSFGDGGEGDDDGSLDGKVRVALADLAPLGTSPQPPSELGPGDIVVAVDATTLEIYAAKLAH